MCVCVGVCVGGLHWGGGRVIIFTNMLHCCYFADLATIV